MGFMGQLARTLASPPPSEGPACTSCASRPPLSTPNAAEASAPSAAWREGTLLRCCRPSLRMRSLAPCQNIHLFELRGGHLTDCGALCFRQVI
jgi:hypothetical protein